MHEFINVVIGMSVDDFGDGVGGTGPLVNVAKCTALDQRGDWIGPMPDITIGTREKGFLARKSEWPDGSLDEVIAI